MQGILQLSIIEVGIPTTTKRGRGAGTWGVELF